MNVPKTPSWAADLDHVMALNCWAQCMHKVPELSAMQASTEVHNKLQIAKGEIRHIGSKVLVACCWYYLVPARQQGIAIG